MIDLLVIEPSIAVRKTLERLLELYGYTMRGVARGSDALLQISRQRPDLILSEVDVPEIGGEGAAGPGSDRPASGRPGAGGLELCRYFKLAGLPVLLMSSEANEALRQESLRAGALDLLSKPLGEQVLLGRLAQHLKLPEPALPLRIQTNPTMLSTLMTRPGILGAGLFGAHGEVLEQVGRNIPTSLYQPFLAQIAPRDDPPRGDLTLRAGMGNRSGDETEGETAPVLSSASGQRFQSAQELQCAQLEFPNHCLLIFRLTGGKPGPSAQPSTLVCLIQNNSYASLIKYHLRSSPYIRL